MKKKLFILTIIFILAAITLIACTDKVATKKNESRKTETTATQKAVNVINDSEEIEARLATIDGDTMIKLIGKTPPEVIAALGSASENEIAEDENGNPNFFIHYRDRNEKLLLRMIGETTVEAIFYFKGKVYGAGTGMTFKEIEKKLGRGEVYYYCFDDSGEKEARDPYYILIYYVDDVVVEFDGRGEKDWPEIPKYISYEEEVVETNIYSLKYFEELKKRELTLFKEND